MIGIYNTDPQVRKVFKPINVIQVGASCLNEVNLYADLHVQKVVFIDADFEMYLRIKSILESSSNNLPYEKVIIYAAVSDQVKQATFYQFPQMAVTNSLFPANSCLNLPTPEPCPVTTSTLDLLLEGDPTIYDTIVLDCQGSERDILAGAKERLKDVQFVFAEVWKIGHEGYAGSGDIGDVDKVLKDFIRSSTQWPEEDYGYAFYHRKEL